MGYHHVMINIKSTMSKSIGDVSFRCSIKHMSVVCILDNRSWKTKWVIMLAGFGNAAFNFTARLACCRQ